VKLEEASQSLLAQLKPKGNTKVHPAEGPEEIVELSQLLRKSLHVKELGDDANRER